MPTRLKQILLIFGVLLYIVSPIDLIPDRIPIVGWLDDLIILGLLLWYLSGFRPAPDRPFGRQASGPGSRAGSLDPYATLGVERSAGTDEIRAAYRRSVAQYHPDKVAHLGKEFQEMAHQKLIAIQQAYEMLMSREKAK